MGIKKKIDGLLRVSRKRPVSQCSRQGYRDSLGLERGVPCLNSLWWAVWAQRNENIFLAFCLLILFHSHSWWLIVMILVPLTARKSHLSQTTEPQICLCLMLGGEASRGSRIKKLALSCLCSHCHPSLFPMSVAPSKLGLCAAPMVGIAPYPGHPQPSGERLTSSQRLTTYSRRWRGKESTKHSI